MIRKVFFFILIVLFILLLIFLNFKNILEIIKNFFLRILEIFISFFRKIVGAVINFIKLIFQIKSIQQENVRLKDEKIILVSKLINSEKLIESYKILEKQFNLKNQNKYKFIPAEVISVSPQETGEFLIINKGKDDGLEVDMPVVVESVLIGKIFEVYSNYSKVILVNDELMKVAVKTQNSAAFGVTENKNSQIYVDFVLKDTKIEKDEIVLSSGRDGVFPPNLILGQIDQLYKSDSQLFQKSKIIPLINYYQLENVFVINNYLR